MKGKKTRRALFTALLAGTIGFGLLIPIHAQSAEETVVSASETEIADPAPQLPEEPAAAQEEASSASLETAEEPSQPEDNAPKAEADQQPADDGSQTSSQTEPVSSEQAEDPIQDSSDAISSENGEEVQPESKEPSNKDDAADSQDSSQSEDPDLKDSSDETDPDAENADDPDSESSTEEDDKPVVFEKTSEGVRVRAESTSRILPADAQMSVHVAGKDSADYLKAVDTLDRQGVDYDDVQVVDISFWKDGVEIEPEQGKVDIQMHFDKSLISEDVQDGSLSVHHIEEQNAHAAKEVADETSQTVSDSGNSYLAEFSVDSFSSFTITWKVYGNSRATITLQMVDENGEEIGTGGSEDLTDSTSTITLAEKAPKINGYIFREGQTKDGKTIDSIRLDYDLFTGQSTLKLLNENTEVETKTASRRKNIKVTVCLVYAKDTHSTLIFNENGGDASAPASISGDTGDVITLPEYSGKREGYIFRGWAEVKNLQSTDYHPLYKAGSTYELSNGTKTLYAVWDRENYSATVSFFIRLDGQLPNEPASHNTGDYSAAINVSNALMTSRWIVDMSHRDDSFKDEVHAQNSVTDNLKSLPTVEQLQNLKTKDNKPILFDPKTDYIHWYVQKYQQGDGWHVDGVLLKKEQVLIAYDRNCDDKTVEVPNGYQRPKGTEVTIGTTGDGKLVTPKRNGYVFLGWTLQQSPGPDAKYYQQEELYILNTNTTFYAQWRIDTGLLTVRKKVEGNAASKQEMFEFSVRILDAEDKPYKKASTNVMPDENGVYTFKLADGNLQVFSVPKGGSYEVTETNTKGYTAAYSIDNGKSTENTSTGKQTFTGTSEVLFTNTKNINPPTGLKSGSSDMPLLTGLALSIGCIGYISFRKGRKLKNDEI